MSASSRQHGIAGFAAGRIGDHAPAYPAMISVTVSGQNSSSTVLPGTMGAGSGFFWQAKSAVSTSPLHWPVRGPYLAGGRNVAFGETGSASQQEPPPNNWHKRTGAAFCSSSGLCSRQPCSSWNKKHCHDLSLLVWALQRGTQAALRSGLRACSGSIEQGYLPCRQPSRIRKLKLQSHTTNSVWSCQCTQPFITWLDLLPW